MSREPVAWCVVVCCLCAPACFEHRVVPPDDPAPAVTRDGAVPQQRPAQRLPHSLSPQLADRPNDPGGLRVASTPPSPRTDPSGDGGIHPSDVTLDAGRGLDASLAEPEQPPVCAAPSAAFPVQVLVQDATGPLVLWLNGEQALPIAGDGLFEFPRPLAVHSEYVLTISPEPAGQACEVLGRRGVMVAHSRTVQVRCAAFSDPIQRAFIKADNALQESGFANALALDGDTLVVGADTHDLTDDDEQDDGGAFYVFEMSPLGRWRQTFSLTGDEALGWKVALENNHLVVGKRDGAMAFARTPQGQWLPESIGPWVPSWGARPELSGDLLALHARTQVWLYDRQEFGWQLGANLNYPRQGVPRWYQVSDVAMDEPHLAVRYGTLQTASIQLYEHIDGSWVEGQLFEDLPGTTARLALRGDWLAVADPGSYPQSGSVRLYQRTPTGFAHAQTLRRSVEGDSFGIAVDLADDLLAVSARRSEAGSWVVHVYRNQSDVWVPAWELRPRVLGENDGFGASLAIDGDRVAVGAPREDSAARHVYGDDSNDDRPESGAAYVFDLPGDCGPAAARTADGHCVVAGACPSGYPDCAAPEGVPPLCTEVLPLERCDGCDRSAECLLTDAGPSCACPYGMEGSGMEGDPCWLGLRGLFVGADSDLSPAFHPDALDYGLRSSFRWERFPFAVELHPGAALEVAGEVVTDPNHTLLFAIADGRQTVLRVTAAGREVVYRLQPEPGEYLTFASKYPRFGSDRTHFGRSLALHADRVAVGVFALSNAPNGTTETVSMYRAHGAGWELEQDLASEHAADAEGEFGRSLAMGPGLLAVGAPSQNQGDEEAAGSVHLFRLTENGWRFDSELTAPAPMGSARFGSALSMGEGLLAVGAPGESIQAATGSAHGAGAVYVFAHQTGDTALVTRLQAPAIQPGGAFGASVALDGDRLLVGAPGSEVAEMKEAGLAYLFELDSGAATQLGLPLELTHADARLGVAVALNGDIAALGAPGGGWVSPWDPHSFSTGSVHVFEREEGLWRSAATLAPPDGQGHFGATLALHGRTLLVGAPSIVDTSVRARVFVSAKVASAWHVTGALNPWAYPTAYGAALAWDGSTVVIGAPATPSGTGRVLLQQ